MSNHPVYESLSEDFRREVAKSPSWFIPHERTMREFIVIDDFDEELLERLNPFMEIPVIIRNPGSLKMAIPPYTVKSLGDMADIIDPNKKFDVILNKGFRNQSRIKQTFAGILKMVQKEEWKQGGQPFFVAELSVDGRRAEALKVQPPIAYRNGDLQHCAKDIDNEKKIGGTPSDEALSHTNYLRNFQLASSNFLTPFHTDVCGAMVLFHLLDGNKKFMLVMRERNDDEIYLDYAARLERSLFRDTADLIPKGFHGRIHLFELKSGMTLLFPSSNYHAVFTPETSLVFSSSSLQVPQIPMHISCNHANVAHLGVDSEELYPEFKYVLLKSLPKLVDWVICASYQSSPAKMQRLKDILNIYSVECKGARGSDLLWYANQFLDDQGKHGNLLKHITGVYFRHADFPILRRIPPFIQNCLLTNVLYGCAWRQTLGANPSDPDFIPPPQRNNFKYKFTTKDWYKPLPEPKVVIDLKNGYLVPLAHIPIKRGQIVGEIRGEILLRKQLKERYTDSCPNGPIFILRTMAGEDGKTHHVFIDCSFRHGWTILCNTTKPANCRVVQVAIGSRLGLALVPLKDLEQGDEISIGGFMYNSLYMSTPPPSPLISPIRINAATGGLEMDSSASSESSGSGKTASTVMMTPPRAPILPSSSSPSPPRPVAIGSPARLPPSSPIPVAIGSPARPPESSPPHPVAIGSPARPPASSPPHPVAIGSPARPPSDVSGNSSVEEQNSRVTRSGRLAARNQAKEGATPKKVPTQQKPKTPTAQSKKDNVATRVLPGSSPARKSSNPATPKKTPADTSSRKSPPNRNVSPVPQRTTRSKSVKSKLTTSTGPGNVGAAIAGPSGSSGAAEGGPWFATVQLYHEANKAKGRATTPKNPAELRCHFCSRDFDNQRQHTDHARYKHLIRKFECETCKAKFPKESDLVAHIKTHYVCKVDGCWRHFLSQEELEDHQSEEHTPQQVAIAKTKGQ